MKDHLRFAVCYWHTFCYQGNDMFGGPTLDRPWCGDEDPIVEAKKKCDAAFEFFTKLGVEYYCFHDRDLVAEGDTLEETNRRLDIISDYMLEKQKETGVRLLWGTANLFGDRVYMNGAATNPDAHVFAYAAAQVKKCMEITKKLGGKNYVFWGGREGYPSILNTLPGKELDHLGRFLRMAVDYKEKIGANFTLLIEPKPREPTKHQYDYDAQTVIGFLRKYHLENDFKLNIEPNHTTLAGHDYEHDIVFACNEGMLGSVDANTGDPMLGWDTDQFPMDVKKAVIVLYHIVRSGGLHTGGLNFDARIRRESVEMEDRFIAHIGAMDTFAHALLIVQEIIQDNIYPAIVERRYRSYNSGIGERIENGRATFEECERYILEHGKPTPRSAKQESFEILLNHYLYLCLFALLQNH